MKLYNAALIATLLVPIGAVVAQSSGGGYGGYGGSGGGYSQPRWLMVVEHNFDSMAQYGLNGTWSDIFTSSVWSPYSVLGFSYPGAMLKASDAPKVTASWVNQDGSPASNPPIDANFLEVSSASWSGPPYATGSASNGLGSPDISWSSEDRRGSSSFGKRLIKKHNAGGTIQFDPRSLSVTANALMPQTSTPGSALTRGMAYSVITDSRSVGIGRYGAIGEKISSNGDVHGDTVYELDLDRNTNRLEGFTSVLSGDWINATYNWSGAIPALGTGLNASYEVETSGYLHGTPKPASTKTISFTSQDTDGATGTANYFLTQHDPWEKRSESDLPITVRKERFSNSVGGHIYAFNVTNSTMTATITTTGTVAAGGTVTFTAGFKADDVVTLGGSIAATVTITLAIGLSNAMTLPPHSMSYPEGHFMFHDKLWKVDKFISAGKEGQYPQIHTASIDTGLGWSEPVPYYP